MSENPIRVYVNKNPDMPGPSQGYDVIEIPTTLLRDLFAGMALQGMISNPKWPNVGPSGLPASEEECAAHWAYGFADALMAERARREAKGE